MAGDRDSPTDSSFEATLRALAANYAAELPAKLAEIGSMLDAACTGAASAADLQLLHRQIHSLNGSAKTFGFPSVSDAARKLELALVPYRDAPATLDREAGTALLALLESLMVAAERPQESAMAGAPKAAPAASQQPVSRLIFLLDKDDKEAASLTSQLTSFAYAVRHFREAQELVAALGAETPAAIIADIDSIEEQFSGETVTELRQGNSSVPMIFLSGRGELGARLRAARAGGDAYFTKPVKTGQLVDRLDSLVNRIKPEPYRVLVVEDAPAQAEYFATVLTQSGIRSSVVAGPETLLEALNDFNPELILMDMYLPGCTGDELARVIRQTDAFMSVPIVFLSVERDFDRQLTAMFKGGDEFLTKPILPAQLVSVVTTRVERYRELRTLMLHDSLTGLVNHSRLQQQMEIETARALRQRHPMSLAMIDIDHFKQVNDRYGHPVGDRVLKNLSRFLRQRLRTSDVVGRYGGEEFAVILSDADQNTARTVMDTLRTDFASIPHEADGDSLKVTFSVGIASVPQHASVRELLVAADQALYKAKREGRNRVVVDGG
ncbi:MAG TPA: diguanylate cyclase [Burkholderiales bacterium]|nr:diguanylate cyclase [Burkholderiales bacterium]